MSSAGGQDGTGSAARFNVPQGAAVDKNGNIYIADTGNNTIRKINSNGVVVTFAGFAGSAGSADGNGTGARFQLPQGIAVDDFGNVYVGDSGNYTIRKITVGGDVSTLAGAVHQSGSADGPGAAARFGYPIGVAVDGSGNVYVADNGNNTIRKITSTGIVSTIAGLPGTPGSADGNGSGARFNFPTGVAYDRVNGMIYVADAGNNTIRKVSSAGDVITAAGLAGNPGNADGVGSAARFESPRGIAVDASGNAYVASTNSQTIRKLTPAAVVTTLGGLADTAGATDGIGSNARFDFPYALAADALNHLYVTDTINYVVRFGVSASETLSLNITMLIDGRKLLSGHALPGTMVTISSANGITGSFTPIAMVMADSNGAFGYIDNATVKRFYRATTSG